MVIDSEGLVLTIGYLITEAETVELSTTDGKSVRLKITGLVPGHIHELLSAGVKSATGQSLLHKEAYYTLNRLPKE